MQASLPCLFYLPFFCILLISANAMATAETDASTNFSLGVIIDYSTRAGKEQKVAMEIAKDDFNARLSRRLNLNITIRDSGHSPFRAVSSAKALIRKHHVRAILGLDKWEEAVLVAELGNKSKIPILSLANEVPHWRSKLWPFLVNAARSDYAQMKAVAAIVQTWQWRRVTVIYEDINSAITGIIPHLIAALQEVDSVIYELLPLPPFSNYSLSVELKNLKRRQGRVFIVHTSIRVAANLFMQAKNMGMMDKEYVWITTNEVTSQIDSLNAVIISSMQGVLGVRSYFSCTGKKYKDFLSKFRAMFKLQYPNESYPGPGIFALQAYDALWAVALAMENVVNLTYLTSPMVSMSGHQLLDIILKSDFEGLTGRFNFVRRVLTPTNIFGLLNVVGKSYNELGYWSSEGLGFSKHVGEGTKYNKSMTVLGQVIWPGSSGDNPRGWALPTSTNRLIIGVPATPAFSEFVKVEKNHTSNGTIATGFSIDVFNATLHLLPYDLPHEFVSYDGHYDDLIQQIQLKKFDAVVGDTAIVARRYEYAEFSQPYSESGLQMLIYVKYWRPERTWLFQKPFTSAVWALTGVVNVYNGFVVWLIERRHNPRFRGTLWNQIGTMISLAFTTLFSLHGERLHSNLSRMTMIVWLFVAVVIIQSYSASLTSLLTLQGLNPVTVDVETLKRSGAKVGCDANSFIAKYLEDVKGFHSENIIGVRSGDDYPELLKNGSIAAAFLQIPYVKVFLAKNCNGFATSGETIKVGGFGFVFPKGAPMLPDISKAVLNVSETGILGSLETTMLKSLHCSASPESDDGHDSLGVSNFWGLFLITAGTSTFAFLVFIFRHARLG